MTPIDPSGPWMYASTALDFLFLEDRGVLDIEVDGRCFRRLDPYYFVWLEHVFSSSKSALQLDGVSDIRLLRALLEPIRAFAKARLAKDDLEEARQRLKRTGVYHPPRAPTNLCDRNPDPAVGTDDSPAIPHPVFARTPPDHIAKDLEVILVVAGRKGFDREDLFGSGSDLAFPLGNDWGLGCFLGGGLQIAHIEPGAIVLTGPPPHHSRLVWRPRERRRSDLMSHSRRP